MHLAPHNVNAQVTDRQDGSRARGAVADCVASAWATAQQTVNPGLEFLGTEGFDHVIVGTQLQTCDPVADVTQCRQQDDRHLGDGTNALHHPKAIKAGHHHVEDHHLGIHGAKGVDCRQAVADG